MLLEQHHCSHFSYDLRMKRNRGSDPDESYIPCSHEQESMLHPIKVSFETFLPLVKRQAKEHNTAVGLDLITHIHLQGLLHSFIHIDIQVFCHLCSYQASCHIVGQTQQDRFTSVFTIFTAICLLMPSGWAPPPSLWTHHPDDPVLPPVLPPP